MNVVIEFSKRKEKLNLLFPSVEVRVVEFINLDAAEVHSGFMRLFFWKEVDFTMLAALVVPIKVSRIIELRLAHRALKHTTIRFSSYTLLALGAILVLIELFRTTTS